MPAKNTIFIYKIISFFIIIYMKRTISNEIELVNAFKECEEGDVIVVNSGTYYLSDTLELNVNNVTVTGDKNKRPVLDFSKTQQGTNGFVVKCDDVHIDNLIIQYAGHKGLLAQTNNSVFENIDTLGNCDCGFQLKRTSKTKVINCCSYKNFGYLVNGFNSDGFCDKQYEGEGNEWINCKSWKNADDGFDFFERITPSDKPTMLKNCVAFDNGLESIDLTDNPRIKTDNKFFEERKCDLEKYPSSGNGNGFKLGGRGTLHNITLDNCVAFNNKHCGFAKNCNGGRIELNFCVSSNNECNFSIRGREEQIIAKNCISTKSKFLEENKKNKNISIYG